MKKRIYLILVYCLVAALIPSAAFAQGEGPTLSLGLIRNFGYGGLGKIQGRFTLRVVDAPDNTSEVTFYMDGEVMEVVTDAPFQTNFHTSDYQDGERVMSATGILDNGDWVDSNTITKVFLSSDQAWAETQQILVPLLAIVGLLTLLGIGAPAIFGRNKEFVAGSYGPAGGAVCPRCALPFARSFLAPNLMVGKLVRCPHCGKISIQSRASSALLEEAEKRYAGEGDAGQIVSDSKDNIQKMLDDSRFEE